MSFGTDGAHPNVVFHPRGASLSGGSGQTGAAKFVLPHLGSQMMTMEIMVYEYSTERSFTIFCGGYNVNNTNRWYNTFATMVGGSLAREYNVRFCVEADGVTKSIVIGETNTVWPYPKMAITKVTFGHTNYGVNVFDDGWDASWITTLPTDIKYTHLLTSPHADVSGGLASPIGDTTPINTDGTVRVLSHISHNEGHINGYGYVDLNFTGEVDVNSSGNVTIKADSITAQHLQISANTDSQANTIYFGTDRIRIYDATPVARVKIGNLA